MFYKKKIEEELYSLYLGGVCIETIGINLKLTVDEVNEIIDYMNEINLKF